MLQHSAEMDVCNSALLVAHDHAAQQIFSHFQLP
jgi:hypothetical protein